MTTQEWITLIKEILAFAVQYGIPAVQRIVDTWDKESVTLEDINKLKTMLKHPDDYEEGSNG